MIRRAAIATFLGFLALSVQGALAQLNYAQRSVNIRAGVVVLDSQQIVPGVQANYNPYVWYNLDSSRQIKPSGWNFHNPAGAGAVTPTIAARWGAINTALGSGIVPVLDARLGKKDAPYWELRLSAATDEQLSQFDVLSLSVQGYLSVNPDERGRLRRFIEAGGVLWVDLTSAALNQIDVVNGLPMPFNMDVTNVAAAFSADWFHPLLSFPGSISPSNLLAMQSENALGLRTVSLAALGYGDLAELQQSTEGDFARFYHVAGDQKGPFLSVARIGDGFMVVTTRGVARTLNRTQRLLNNQLPSGTYIPNNLSVAENLVPDATTEAAAKIVVNMVHLVSGSPQFGKGAHKANGGPIDVSAPLLQKFSVSPGYDPGPSNYLPPAVYKGCVAIVFENRLWVFDADPARDMDKDGNPDDGVQDFSFGQSYDLLWISERTVLTGPVSPPTCAEVPNSTIVDQISVVDGQGRLCVFNLHSPGTKDVMPVFVSGPPPSYSPPGGGDAQRGPYAPTFYDGCYFIADDVSMGLSGVVGRVWVANAADGQMMSTTAPWAVGGNGVGQIQRPSAPVTVGDIPIQDGSGGTDRVVYIPTRPNPLGGPQATAGLTSLWFGVKGEKPANWTEAGNQLVVVTRASLQGLRIHMPAGPDPLGIKLSVIDGNGNPLDAAAMNTLFTTGVSESNGILTFTKRGAAVMPANASVRVDYTIDWGTGNAGVQNQIIRGNVFLPDDTAKARVIVDHVALSPTGMLYFVASNPDPTATGTDGGTYYAMQESARGNFLLKDRYDLYPAHTVTLNQAAPINYAETLFDTDELTTFAGPFLSGSFTRLRFRSGPVVVGDTVYLTAAGYKFGGLVPCTIVMAFKADPETAEILLPEINGSFTLLQPDFARNDNRARPTTFSILQGGQFVYEGNQGNGRGRIRISNLSPNQRGLIQNSISRSQPVIIRRAGQPDILVEPDRTASNWSTLQWFAVYHGYDNASPPTVAGNTLYFGAKSVLPSILRGDPFPSWTTTGLILGMDSVISPSDAFLHDNPTRPWLKQLWQIDRDNPTPGAVAPNPDIRMPQMRGVTSFEEWRQRLFQSTIASRDSFGVIAGDGMLFSWGTDGLFGFSRADFIVADESRLARFDSSGNPLWSSDNSATTGTNLDSGAAGVITPLVRPTRAYALNARELMVVDTGADRIIQLDRNGREIRSISSFHLDPQYTPEGFTTNAPLTLRQPRDVYVYGTYVKSHSHSMPKLLEYWVHYLIADTGNHRLIELIDRYEADPVTRRIIGVILDSQNVRALGVLNWHSPATYSGGQFNYTGVSSLYDAYTGAPRRVYVAGIGGGLPTRVGLGLDSPSAGAATTSQEGNGGIIVFNDASSIVDVIEKVWIPDIPANVLWDPNTASFNSAAEPGHFKKLSNVRSVNVRFQILPVAGVQISVMFADNDGVYEIYHNGTDWVVNWMLPKAAYRVMRRNIGDNRPTDNANPLDFLPTYARRLESGQVLIVNGYGGKMQTTNPNPATARDFFGEVIEVDGAYDGLNNNAAPGYSLGKQNFGFSWFSVLFQLPPVTGARGIVMPVFADRR